MLFSNNPTNPYPSTRNATYGRNGMVATSQPLAAQAGLDILKYGGNAIDAAIATAACLTVVEPTSNGIGGDAFALIWTKGQLHGLNGSGRSPRSISIDTVKATGNKEVPKYGWIPVTVPGAPAAWAELSKQFGRLNLADVLTPAVQYAEKGFPIPPTVSQLWHAAYVTYKENLEEESFANWSKTFAPKGRAPRVGEVWSSKDHAETLRDLGRTAGESFYRGRLAQKIANFSKVTGGFLNEEDLAQHESEWVRPISVKYRGYDVWEAPPNSQGIIALQALKILEGFSFTNKESVDTLHRQIEAIKLAFADGYEHITECGKMPHSVESLLSERYASERRALIKEEACVPEAGEPSESGTVYLCTADNEGNMVSFIQSNYKGFGSGLVVPGTGIALNNRGHEFSMEPDHINVVEGGKRPFHTIMPGFLTKDDNPIGPFGVMGGYMQPQGHLQVITNAIDFGLNPQASLDAPRWKWLRKNTVEVEHQFPQHTAQELARRGHDVRYALDSKSFGRGQIIWRDPETGVLVGGSETRTDGTVATW